MDTIHGWTRSEWGVVAEWAIRKGSLLPPAATLDSAIDLQEKWFDCHGINDGPLGDANHAGATWANELFKLAKLQHAAALAALELRTNPPRVVAEGGTSRSVFDLNVEQRLPPGYRVKSDPNDFGYLVSSPGKNGWQKMSVAEVEAICHKQSDTPAPDLSPGTRVDGAFGRGTLSPDGKVLSLDFPQSQPSNLQPGTAPKVTPADIEAEIASEWYYGGHEGVIGQQLCDPSNPNNGHVGIENESAAACLKLLTHCVLVLRNGFTVTGESACASPENFDAEVGRKLARIKAVDKVWPLLGFRLRDQLSDPTNWRNMMNGDRRNYFGTDYLLYEQLIDNPEDFGYLLITRAESLDGKASFTVRLPFRNKERGNAAAFEGLRLTASSRIADMLRPRTELVVPDPTDDSSIETSEREAKSPEPARLLDGDSTGTAD